MLENPPDNLNVLGNSFAEIRFKELYLSNHLELVTCTYEISFPTTTNTISSNNTELLHRSRYIYVHYTENV